ncbi:putative adhesin [Kitasatospora sp. NPDC094016]|uniref:putative adhesin n=1 Tax=Kitasatospora sp. NPDC094016 TaxID=3154986 RepID=UPI0033213017
MHAHDRTKGAAAGKARTPARTSESATRNPNRAQAAAQSLLGLQSSHGNAAVVQMLRATGIQRAADQNRPMINHQNPDDDWEADNTAPARTDGLVLSGHGAWEAANGTFRVPAGTRVHFYTQHGMVLPDDLGGQVENGANRGGSVEQGQDRGAARTVVGGRSLQNYTISYPSGLTIRGNPAIASPVGGGYDIELDPGTPAATVINVATLTDPQLAGRSIVFDGDVLLSDILRPGMGDVHFAACRFVETNRPGTRNQGRPQGYNGPGDLGEAGGLYNP